MLSQMSRRTSIIDTSKVREEFQTFGEDVVARIDVLKMLSSGEIANVRDDIMRLAEQRSADAAVSHVKQVTITR